MTAPHELGARISKEDLITVIYNEIDRSVDYANTTLKETRRKAWDYYLNRPRGDEIEGRSTVQDTSVRDAVHHLLATIMPAYATDSVVQFEPAGPDDLDQAEAESHAVNNLFTESNQGYFELYNAVSDALLFRNGIVKVWVEETEEVTHRRFDTAQAPVSAVLAQAPEGWEHVETDEDGIATFRVTEDKQKLEVECVEPAYFYTDPNAQDQQLNECGFLAELVFYTRSELLQLGVSKKIVKDLPHSQDKSTTEGIGQTNTDITAKFLDGITDIKPSTTADRDQIQCHWVHMKIDRDGDGIGEKYRFLVSNRRLLLDDPVNFFPYASGAAWPVPHRWSGQGVYDLLRITQDERTNARRQLADNLNVANNQRPVYDPAETSQEDVNTGAPGRGVRSTNPANVGWMPVQDVVSNSVSFLQYMDGVRSEQVGASMEMASGEGQLVQQASGISVDMQLAPREQMAAMASRNLAETLVRNTFLLMHETLRTEWRQPIMFNKAGEWQQTNPTEWRPRSRLNVTVGLSPGERRRQLQALQYVHQTQLMMIQGGAANITTSWDGVHAALNDWMRAAELDGTEGYFLDPDSQESQAGQQAAMQSQQQQAQQQQQMVQMQAMIEEADRKLDKYKHDTDLQFKYWEALLDAETEQDKIDASQAQQSAQAGRDSTGSDSGQKQRQGQNGS